MAPLHNLKRVHESESLTDTEVHERRGHEQLRPRAPDRQLEVAEKPTSQAQRDSFRIARIQDQMPADAAQVMSTGPAKGEWTSIERPPFRSTDHSIACHDT